MGSSANAMVGVFIDLPSMKVTKMVKIHGCSNENCENHVKKVEMKKNAQFCFKCGHATGKIDREHTFDIDASEFTTDDLMSNFENEILYDSKFMHELSVHYQNDMRVIDLTKAAKEIEEFKTKHEGYLKILRQTFKTDVLVKYGVFVEWH